ncbi:hypothetical protein FH972_022738 [Carpinus fangiana]|uniref:Uncharacterized protein n=1 Tax=Carpinus fangiana TaxID=176857 RepID=A0A5N6KT48_9ROSI|nr:hypothetical protein FH972_022738 [Carpinus fangiana]
MNSSSTAGTPPKPNVVGRKPVPSRPQALTHLCPHCGTGVEALPLASPPESTSSASPSTPAQTSSTTEDAAQKQLRIEQLQMEVDRLAGKASAASDKLADYEDEIRSLRAQTQQHPSSSLLTPGGTPPRPHTADEARSAPSGADKGAGGARQGERKEAGETGEGDAEGGTSARAAGQCPGAAQSRLSRRRLAASSLLKNY